jgi:hypothetical protein
MTAAVEDPVHHPLAYGRHLVASAWQDTKTIYYANTRPWRVIKSGALLFFGFFLWTAGNVLLSVQPAWTWLYFPMAYGFVLIPYGPIHHLFVIPFALKWRRERGRLSSLGEHLPNAGLVSFLVVVLILATVPPGVMAFDFDSTIEGAGVDVDPNLLCTKHVTDAETTVHCHLTESRGIDHVTVESGGEQIVVDRDPPFEFEVTAAELNEVVGQQQFQVVLRDEDGNAIRRYTRNVASIREG